MKAEDKIKEHRHCPKCGEVMELIFSRPSLFEIGKAGEIYLCYYCSILSIDFYRKPNVQIKLSHFALGGIDDNPPIVIPEGEK